MNEIPKRPMFQVSIDSTLLAKRLTSAAVGDTVPYGELSALIGRDVCNGARGCLTSARHRLLRESHMLFDPVRGEGLRRLNDVEKVGAGTDGTYAKVRRVCARGRQIVAAVDDYAALPPEAQQRYNAGLSVLGILQHQLKSAQITRVERAVEKALAPLSLQKTLAQFGLEKEDPKV